MIMSTIEDAMNKLKKSNKANNPKESANSAREDNKQISDQELDQAADLQRIASEYEDELNPEEFWHGGMSQSADADADEISQKQSFSKESQKVERVQNESCMESGKESYLSRVESGIHNIDLNALKKQHIIVPNQRDGALIEEFRAIKRPLLNNAFGEVSKQVPNSNIIMVTSALPGEGKTFTSLNLAMSMATEMDTTVLLIDADIPRPSISEFLGLNPNLPGLIDILLDDQIDLSDVLIKTNIDNLVILPAGRGHANATEIMASTAMSELMNEISQRYSDRVTILDSPPLLITSEAKVLAEKVGQVVMVVESNQASHEQVTQAVEMLDDNDIVNLVLNKSRAKSLQPYYGSYSRYKK